MYEYAVNKYACPIDVTLQSVYEVQSNDLLTITIPWTLAIAPINSASLANNWKMLFAIHTLAYFSYCTETRADK